MATEPPRHTHVPLVGCCSNSRGGSRPSQADEVATSNVAGKQGCAHLEKDRKSDLALAQGVVPSLVMDKGVNRVARYASAHPPPQWIPTMEVTQ